MKTNSFRTLVLLLLVSFTFHVTMLTPLTYSQSIEQVNEDIGGSGSTSNQGDSGSDNTFLYIAAGVIIIGLIVWKVVIDKKKPKTENDTKSDSTKISLKETFNKNFSDQKSELQKIYNQMPVEIFLGWKSNQQNIHGGNLSLGLKFKL